MLDREFGYELLFVEMAESDIQYAIRLNVGNRPTIRDKDALLKALESAYMIFRRTVFGNVRTFV